MSAFVTLYAAGFLRTVVIIAIIYLGVRLISRYLLPVLLNKGIQKMQQKMQNPQNYREPQRQEGEVTVENKPQNQTHQSGHNTEYADFEEVD